MPKNRQPARGLREVNPRESGVEPKPQDSSAAHGSRIVELDHIACQTFDVRRVRLDVRLGHEDIIGVSAYLVQGCRETANRGKEDWIDCRNRSCGNRHSRNAYIVGTYHARRCCGLARGRENPGNARSALCCSTEFSWPRPGCFEPLVSWWDPMPTTRRRPVAGKWPDAAQPRPVSGRRVGILNRWTRAHGRHRPYQSKFDAVDFEIHACVLGGCSGPFV